MKNQHFGDRNDFFKYDLSLSLIEQIDELRGFTFVPMLTPDVGSGDGTPTHYAVLGSHRPALYQYLKTCVADPARRRVASLKHFMSRHEPKVRYREHGETAYLTDGTRAAYFGGIPQLQMKASVILVDPDNGFEVKSTSRATEHKYLRYSELADLYRAMGRNSVLLASQHWPGIARQQAFDHAAFEIAERLPDAQRTVCISSGAIGLFAIAKNDDVLSDTRCAFERYASSRGFTTYA